MPSPPFVTLPEGVRRVWVETERGAFAALSALPPAVAARTTERAALLVPGFTGSKENFIAVLRPLADAGHHVVAIDMRGQYETPGPEDAKAYTVPELGADVAGVLGALEAGPVHLVGHSLGGLVAREVALTATEKLASLTLLDSGAGALTGPRADHARALMDALPAMDVESVWAAMEEFNAADPAMAARTPEVIDYQHRRFVQSSPTGIVAMGDAMLTEPDRVEEFAEATSGLRVLTAYGADDNAWSPAEQADMARRLGSREAVIPAAGHSPASDKPDETARVLTEFWSEVESATASG